MSSSAPHHKASTIGILLVGVLALALVAAGVLVARFVSPPAYVAAEMHELKLARFVAEVPLSDATLARVLQGGDAPAESFELRIPHHHSGRTQAEGVPLISPQIAAYYGDAYPKGRGGDLRGEPFAFYVDVPAAVFATLARPKVFFMRMHGAWTLYADDALVHSGRTGDRYLAIQVPPPRPGRDAVRLTWRIENRLPEFLIALDAMHGLTVRSERSATWTQRMYPLFQLLPSLVAGVALLCFALVAVLLAGVARRFDDLWAFAVFSVATMTLVGFESPITAELMDTDDLASLVPFQRFVALVYSAYVVVAACLTLTFFRLRGRALWTGIGATVLAAVCVGARGWPASDGSNVVAAQMALFADTARFLVATQLGIALLGGAAIWAQIRRFERAGLDAMLVPMRRRIVEAASFLAALWLMMIMYVDGLQSMVNVSGDETILFWGLVPATALFVQLCWSATAGDRFRQRMLPRLDYVDHLVEHLGERSYGRTYCGVLAVFDLAGFKELTRLKQKSPEAARVIDRTLRASREELEQLVASGRTVFRYKSNGDESIWVLHAKDEAEARRQLVALVTAWRAASRRLVEGWRRELRAIDQAVEIDVHVAFCVVSDLRIDPIGDDKRPDFSSDRFTLLSAAFKRSTHTCVAMYEAEAAMVVAAWDGSGRFLPSGEGGTIGVLDLEARAAASRLSA